MAASGPFLTARRGPCASHGLPTLLDLDAECIPVSLCASAALLCWKAWEQVTLVKCPVIEGR